MQSMTIQQTESPRLSIPLESLSSEDKPLPETPDVTEEDSLSYNSSSILRATEISVRKVENPRLRVKLRDVISNNIARRTLKITILFGVLTILYYCISLVPAFRAAGAAVESKEIQIKSAAGSSQGLAFGFLQECTNRLVGSGSRAFLSQRDAGANDLRMF
jgi:hypothetical protein